MLTPRANVNIHCQKQKENDTTGEKRTNFRVNDASEEDGRGKRNF